MKKTCKTMLSLLLALVMALSLSVSAFAADPTVDIVYKGENALVITPKTTEFTTTDLFGGFKGVMPGDTRTETVATMTEFLSQLSMKVWNGTELIYEASPDELDGLAEPKLLGTFRKGETATLTVELTVPLELDNDFANRLGEVDWKFTAEEYTSGGGKPTVTPGTLIQTGQLNWPIAVLAAAGGVLIALGWVILRKKRHGNA